MKTTNLSDKIARCVCLAATWCVIGQATAIRAQVQQAWVAHYNNGITNGTHQAAKMAFDSTGDILVTGYSQNVNSNLGYVTLKYAPNGNQLWAARYDSSNSTSVKPVGLVIDNSNNIIVTGTALTVKYDSHGNQLWTEPYSAAALQVDSGANVYLTGYSTNFNTVKLNSSGSNLWQTTYVDNVGPTLSQAIFIDNGSNIYIAGSDNWYHDSYSYYVRLLVLKYNTNGTQIWAATDEATASASFAINGFSMNSAALLYIGVNTSADGPDGGYNVFTCNTNGAIAWIVSDPTSNTGSVANGFQLDSSNNIDLTGSVPYKFTHGSLLYYCSTFKFTASGLMLWQNNYPSPFIGSTVGNALAVDSSNNVYVTGYSPGATSGNDIVTIKYGPNGNQEWLQRYNGPGNGNDAGNAIAVDNSGNVYVTGYDTLPGGGTEIVTIKYSPLLLQRHANGTVQLQAQGASGETFQVEATSDSSNWTNIGQGAADTNGLFLFDDTNAPLYPYRLYYTIPQ